MQNLGMHVLDHQSCHQSSMMHKQHVPAGVKAAKL